MQSQQSHRHSAAKGNDRNDFESRHAHRCCRRRGVRRVLRANRRTLDQGIPAAFCCPNIFESCRARGPASRRRHRMRGIRCDPSPRHGSLPCQRRRTRRGGGGRERFQNDEALCEKYSAHSCVVRKGAPQTQNQCLSERREFPARRFWTRRLGNLLTTAKTRRSSSRPFERHRSRPRSSDHRHAKRDGAPAQIHQAVSLRTTIIPRTASVWLSTNIALAHRKLIRAKKSASRSQLSLLRDASTTSALFIIPFACRFPPRSRLHRNPIAIG